MKTLIALDGSSDAICAMRTAMHLLSPISREISLLCVAPPMVRRPQGEPRRDYDRRILAEAHRIIERAHAELPPGAGPVTRLAEIGSVAATIIDKSRDHDLVVLGDKGRGTSGNVGLGPVTSRVLEHAPSAVLIGREMTAQPEELRILVTVDGSAASHRAIELICTGFDLNRAEVCLMHVAETPWVHLGLEEDWYTAGEEEQDRSEPGAFEREMVREGEQLVQQAKRWLHIPRLSVTTNIVQGNPADEIISEAERGGYHLIVMGASDSHDLKHRMLGSVSTKVAWNAPCSVLVVKEPGETG